MHGYGGLAWGVVGPVEVVLLFQRSPTSSGLTLGTSPRCSTWTLLSTREPTHMTIKNEIFYL